MPWQDIVLTAGSWIFIAALIPTLRGKEKPAAATSVVTGLILVAFAAIYATLELWMSVLSTSALAISWFVLAAQKMRNIVNPEKKQDMFLGYSNTRK